MTRARVLIIGAGLAGLYAAWALQNRGFRDFLIIEARPRTGGRIATGVVTSGPDACPAPAPRASDRFDLGPTWFWPGYQRELDQLITTLGLSRYPQYESGQTMLESAPGVPPHRIEGFVTQPTSMRLEGGMQSLVDALAHRIDAARIVTGQVVQRISRQADGVQIEALDARGQPVTWQGETVLLAVPPRLAEANLRFDPPLPTGLAAQWRDTPTWMAPHAKYVAVYDDAFWRSAGLSGDARSAVGPMAEIHDASTAQARAALFGFIGIPADVRQRIGEQALITHCRAQLVRLFGQDATNPRQEFLKDWSADAFTATADDLHAPGHHAPAPDALPGSGPWRGHLIGIASEWSPQFPGYLAGAIEAARGGVEHVLPQPAPHTKETS